MTCTLYGYKYSVYNRVARICLTEKKVFYKTCEVNPFDPKSYPAFSELHPFFKVPVLVDGDFKIYETAAITRYIDEKYSGPNIQPKDPEKIARMTQIISMIDSYGYWPLVRQVFSHQVFRPQMGEEFDKEEISLGLLESEKFLSAIEQIFSDDRFICGHSISLADIHLAPMVDYFQQASEGKLLLSNFEKLSIWWNSIRLRRSIIETDPMKSI